MSRTRSITLPILVALLGLGAIPAAPTASSAQASDAQVCALFESEVMSSPLFASPFRVMRVEPITERRGRVQTGTVVGARISISADPGLSRPGAASLLQCRLAKASEDDAFAHPSSRVVVHETPTGYVVEITARRREQARAILAKAESLLAR